MNFQSFRQKTGEWIFMLAAVCILSGIPAPASAPAGFASLPLSWVDETGKPGVRLSDWAGRPMVLTLAYTQCRRVCPSTTYKNLRLIQRALKARGVQAEYVVVTLDPESDTPAVLRAFKEKFGSADEHWHFLTGEMAAVRALAEAGDFKFWMLDNHVVHDFRIWGVDARGVLQSTMDLGHLDVETFVRPL